MEKILKNIEKIEQEGGCFAWAVVDVQTDEMLWSGGVNRSVKAASLIKLFIEEIALDHLEERVPFSKKSAVPFSLLAHLEERTYRVADLATMMIALSDNTATNVLIDHLDLDRLSKRISSGYPGTRLQRHMMDGEARARGKENTTTVNDVVAVLGNLANRARALSDLAEQHDRSLFLRELDDEAIRFAHKTGSLDDQKADAGILEIDDRRYIVVGILDDYPEPIGAKQHLGDFFEFVYRCAKGACPWPVS